LYALISITIFQRTQIPLTSFSQDSGRLNSKEFHIKLSDKILSGKYQFSGNFASIDAPFVAFSLLQPNPGMIYPQRSDPVQLGQVSQPSALLDLYHFVGSRSENSFTKTDQILSVTFEYITNTTSDCTRIRRHNTSDVEPTRYNWAFELHTV
jgi:hypothetical protein